MHLPNIPPEIQHQIIDAMKRPEGTLVFNYHSDEIFDREKPRGILLEIVTGKIIFRLERDEKLNLKFYHSSPGTDTRVATVSLEPFVGSSFLKVFLVWSTNETGLHVGGDSPDKYPLVSGKGEISKRRFRIGENGSVFQIGDEGVEVMEVNFIAGGKSVLTSTAIEAWRNTIQGIKILFTGQSTEGYIFEVVTTNLIIVMLVTGYEAYCKKRFVELEDEGLKVDFDSLANSFLSQSERKNGEIDIIKSDAMTEGISPLKKFVQQGRIDFQNYNRCKTAYNKGYGISFGNNLKLKNTELEEIQSLIKFRHKIVHISATIGMLNIERVPPEEPIFPKREYAERSQLLFDKFINSIHEETLKLRITK